MANLSGQPDVIGGQARGAAWGAALMLAAAAVYTLFSFWLINGALWVTTTALAFLIQDLGWVMATIAVVLTAAVTALMLSGPAVTRAIALSLGVGSVILLADLFGWQLGTITDANGAVFPDVVTQLTTEGDYWLRTGVSWVLLPFGLIVAFAVSKKTFSLMISFSLVMMTS